MAETTLLAWHFLPDDGMTQFKHKNGGRFRVKTGQTLHWNGPLKMCESGLHASIRAIDALRYAPGALVCRVECSGTVVHQEDKLVCSRRKVLWMVDATEALHEFACWCAEKALRRAKVKDKRSWAAIKAKRRWLLGEIGDDELAAARPAAWDAAWSAAWDAAWSAAWAAARAAAWAAARSAAGDAAGDAAWDAAGDAARDAQNKQLEGVLLALEAKE